MAVSGKKGSAQFSSQITSTASDEGLHVYCQPCDEEENRIPAHGYCTNCEQHLCKTCFTVHKKHKLSKHHTLLDATSMPKSIQQPSTTIQTNQSDDMTMPCHKHSKELIKFFCYKHKELLCCVCATLEHPPSSCKVNYIPDISGNIINSKQYKDILDTVNSTYEQYQQIAADARRIANKNIKCLKVALADIKKFRERINLRLDELEKDTEDTAKVLDQENQIHLNEIETACKDVSRTLKTLSSNISQLNTLKQADKLFMELKLAEKTMNDIQERSLQTACYKMGELTYKLNDSILDILKKENSFVSWIQAGDACILGSEDNTTCWITGMTFLTPDLIIVADHDNKSIKMVDSNSHLVSDQLHLGDKPWDVTSVTSSQLAVTLPDKQTIQFVSVSSYKLKSKASVTVAGNCYGVSCYQDKLVVSFFYPAKLQILDMNYTILTSFGQNIVNEPRYITSNSSSIYVSDLETRKITRFNWKGEVTGSYSRIGYPSGLALPDADTILVCDKERNVIKEISGDLSVGKVILKNVKTPFALCVCEETRKLYYSCYGGDYRDVNYAHMYKLS